MSRRFLSLTLEWHIFRDVNSADLAVVRSTMPEMHIGFRPEESP